MTSKTISENVDIAHVNWRKIKKKSTKAINLIKK